MKRIFTLGFAAILMIGSAVAQGNQKPARTGKAGKEWKKDGDHGKHKGAKNMDLTDDQKTQMKAVKQEYKSQIMALKEAGVAKDDPRYKAIREEKKTKMQGILTEDQKNKMKAQKGEGKRFKGADRKEKMKEELGLTNEQASQLKAQNETFRTQMQALQKNESLSREEKKAQMEALKNQHREGIRSILTTEQMQKLEAGKKMHGEGKHRKEKRNRN